MKAVFASGRVPLFPRGRVAFLLGACALLLAGWAEARACSCGGAGTVLDAYERAGVVVIVRVDAVEGLDPSERAAHAGRLGASPLDQTGEGRERVAGAGGVFSTKVTVEKVYKGRLRPGDVLTFGQGGGADCIWTFDDGDLGRRFLFYTSAPKGPGLWYAGTCGRSSPVEYARDDLLYLDDLKRARGRTRLSGTVRFEGEGGGDPAGLKLRFVGPRKSFEVRTDEHGVYEVYDVPPGKYRVVPEVPHGWKVDEFWLRYSRSLVAGPDAEKAADIYVQVEPRRHAALDLHFEVDNAIAGRVLDPSGRPMDGVCLKLLPAEGEPPPGFWKLDCTEGGGLFRLEEVPPGRYLLVANDDGKVSSSEPFGTFYYPSAARREEAAVISVAAGEFVEGLVIHAPVTHETVLVEGVLLYSDGKPVAGKWVRFNPAPNEGERGEDEGERGEDEGERGEDEGARADTDARGRFLIRILRGRHGSLRGEMYTFAGEYENCPKLDAVVRQYDTSVPLVQTPPLEIRADTDLSGVELRYPFPGCKKAKIE